MTAILTPEPDVTGLDPLGDAPRPDAPDLAPPPAELAPRLLGRVQGGVPGRYERRPTLVCVGGLHGNEPAGVLALERVFAALEADATGLRGQLVGFSGNRKALALGRRFLDHDLNRHWLPDRVARLRAAPGALAAEDEELRELDAEIEQVLTATRGKVFVLDLHTTSGAGVPFATLDDSLRNRKFALEMPVPLVLGLEEELAGTLTSFLNGRGITNLGFESGQHEDPEAVDCAAAAIWVALEASGVLKKGSRPEVEAGRRRLRDAAGPRMPHVVEVRHRHPIHRDDAFKMLPGFRNFDAISAGQVLAHDQHGPVRSPEKGRILMPLYQAQGDDGYFLVRRVRRVWLGLSASLRRLRLERWLLPYLPGVRRHAELPGTFVVDRRTARYGALELFHLLGFHRRGARTDRKLTLSRRDDGVR